MKNIIVLLALLSVSLYGVNLNKLKVSGKFDYEIEKRMKDRDYNSAEREAEHNIDIDVKLEYPLTEEMSMVGKLDEKTKTDEKGEAPGIEFDQAYFTHTQRDLSVQFGLQEIAGPLAYEVNGDGILAIKSTFDYIIAGGYFINNTYTGADEIYEIAIVGEMKKLNYAAWYGAVVDSDYSATQNGTPEDNGRSVMHFSIYKVEEKFKFGVMHSMLSANESAVSDQSQTNLYIEGKDKAIQYKFAYIMTGTNGGNVALDQNRDSEINFSLDETGADIIKDGKAYYVGVQKILDNTKTVELEYFTGDGFNSTQEVKVSYNSYIKKDLYFYFDVDQWDINSIKSEKIEMGINIEF
jgi:hypothetical protein